ncbi:CaiB/BaiF CoA transferase family protein [Blastococcus sp. SYSU DS0533]
MIAALAGLRVVELAGLGPAPFCGTLLADLGADVVRVDRATPGPPAAGVPDDPRTDYLGRSRRSVAVDLKQPAGREVVLALAERADVLIEGFRPGVVERLGVGPADALARNPRLVYGRMTGWGQDGPYAGTAGHDLTYLAVTGALHAIGRADQPPPPPLNVIGDFGGGGAFLTIGVLAAVLRARETGHGQVVDASIVDGTAALLGMVRGFHAGGEWLDRRQTNTLDGGAPYYGVYRCSDGRDVAVGAIEPRFWATLLACLGVADDPVLAERDDRAAWPRVRARLAEVLATRPRDHWVEACSGTDACLAPVLSLEESLEDPHARARGAFADVEGVLQPAPAPRLSASPCRPPYRAPRAGQHTREVLAELGLECTRIDELIAAGAARPSDETADTVGGGAY